MRTNRQWRTGARATGALVLLFALAVPTVGGGTVLDRIGLAAKSVPPATTVAPPTIVSAPDNPTYATTATFTYTGPTGATFRCRVDNTPFSVCSTGMLFDKLSRKTHSFDVQAVDSAGNTSAPASYSWEVVKRITFAVSGDADGLLYPGVEQPINLVLTNPHNFAVTVTAVTVAIDDRTSVPGCSARANVSVSKPFTGPVSIPGNGTIALSDSVYSEARPRLLMANLATNQDECKNAAFHLTYLATASKR